MRFALTFSALSMLAGCASSPDRPTASERKPVSPDEVCAVAQCGYGIRVELKQKDGSAFSQVYDALPVVQEAGVSVYGGNSVQFEAEVVDGVLTNLRLVKEVLHPERTVTAKLEQGDDGHMMLVTTNPFDKPLRIRMGVMPLSHDRLVRTSSCPVMSKGSSFEMWPYPIFQVFLGDMRLMKPDESMVCAE
jgi:hypothetical protein